MQVTLPALAKLKPNPHWANLPLLDRKGWRTMAFGEFAESVNERVEPSTAAEEMYVGLDDLDSGSLHIRRWGKGSDVIGTKLRFRKADIIFGRRRAYQRKLTVTEMDGICSARAMVVRANPISGLCTNQNAREQAACGRGGGTRDKALRRVAPVAVRIAARPATTCFS